MRGPDSLASAPFISTSTRPDPLRPQSTRTAAAASASIPVAADTSLSSLTPPPTRHRRSDTSDLARDGLSADAVLVVAEPSAVPAGDAHSIMAQRPSSYPLSSPSDQPGKRQRAWQHFEEQNHKDGQAAALTLNKAATASTTGVAPQNLDDTAMPHLHPQTSDYRAKLTRDLELRELSARGLPTSLPTAQSAKAKVSPIAEEDATAPSPMLTSTTTLTNASTESGNTVRGDMTPALPAQTPSYPFPRMPSFSQQLPKFVSFPPMSPSSRHQPTPSTEHRGLLDRLLSDSSTPASAFTFEPVAPAKHPQNTDFPTPSLYDLSLLLAAEPGLDAWWNTVVQIMRDVYKAERITLAVPADTTDVENVPWGQRATFNAHHEDKLSLGYMARSSSAFQSSEYEPVLDGFATPLAAAAAATATTTTTPDSISLSRPGIRSRHSFTAFEDSRPNLREQNSMGPPKRPTNLMRSKTQYPSPRVAVELKNDYTKLNKNALSEHDAAADAQLKIPSWEVPFLPRNDGQGRVLPVLQALDYEADPLIDHTGIMRVLERGHPVALTRTYPYLPRSVSEPDNGNDYRNKSGLKGQCFDPKRPKKQRTGSISTLSSFLPGTSRSKVYSSDKMKTFTPRSDDEDCRPPTPRYEEYEQAPPSPWSQSPAPSPAVRNDSQENPFFTDAMVNEDSFNPGSTPTIYAGMRPPQAIGVDNSWTVLHIPLKHVLLSKPTRSFRLDASALESKSNSRAKNEGSPDRKIQPGSGRVTPEHPKRKEAAPIAILSILSPIIPYPANLRHSLECLAPHMATSFSLCRHYSNLETELAGIRRRRPSITGFGAVGPFANGVQNAMLLAPNSTQQHSSGGSITSPSDYSVISKSATASPMATPGWEHSSLNHLVDRRQPPGSPSAGLQAAESYFASRQKVVSKQENMTPANAKERTRPAFKEGSSVGEKRQSLLSGVRFENEALRTPPEQMVGEGGYFETVASSTPANGLKYADGGPVDGVDRLAGRQDAMIDHPSSETSANSQKPTRNGKSDHGKADHVHHTVLHSYGADFASTFQSLPPSSSLSTKMPHATLALARSGSLTSMTGDMPPPSDRLKGLILDSLPAHVFVSLPQTGETVWVNSRFLSYRGQTVADLSADPWGSIHQEDKEGYLEAWSHSLRTGEQFSRSVRIKRFDGAYRWFYARAVASKDKRGVIMQFLGSYMDIHDQRMAELKATRQAEIEESESKHRLLANLIPQIIFTATEDDSITFANDQWLSYTGQSFDDALGLGFLDYVHPNDLMRCRIPASRAIKQQKASAYLTEGESGSHDTPSSGKLTATMTQKSAVRTSREAWSAANGAKAAGELTLGGPSSDVVSNSAKLTAAPTQKSVIKTSQEASTGEPTLNVSSSHDAPSSDKSTAAPAKKSAAAGVLSLGETSSHDTSSDKPTAGLAQKNTGKTSSAAAGTKAARKLTLEDVEAVLSRTSSSGGELTYSLPSAELAELARKGVIKLGTDTSGRPSYTTEVRLRSKTGDYRWHLIRCVEIDTLDFGRGASSYFGSATDINDHKLLEAKLKEAMESKGRFLSNMSHEIRTPLIGISGMVSFLQDTPLNEEQRDYTNTIQTSANSLIMIINDILDLSKVDAGMMKLKYDWFHTRSLLEDVNELVSTMAIAKRLELNYLIETDVPTWVKGDKVRIRQVLLNVIGNAIKFTSEGEVFSRCKIYTESESDDPTVRNEHDIMLQFAVIDTGRGFTKEEADLIFKPFSQIDGSSTRQHGGSGLGLVISRQLVELHGGKMEGTAVPGQGSTFTFTAKFTLPSAADYPDNPASPDLAASVTSVPSAASRQGSSEDVIKTTTTTTSSVVDLPAVRDSATKEDAKGLESALDVSKATSALSSPLSALGAAAAAAAGSPEAHARLTRHLSGGSSTSPSANAGLARFSEAAKASGQDLSKMALEVSPSRREATTVELTSLSAGCMRPSDLRPSMFSILIICPQNYSREATTKHIEMTLPKDVPHQITAIATVEEAEPFLGGHDPIIFTHIVVNLASAEAIVDVMDRINQSPHKTEGTTIVVLTDSVQRQAVQKLLNDGKDEKFLTADMVTFIYKPVKPSKFAVIFDPDKVQDLSVDRNRSTAQQMVENQKASYQEIEKRMGNKGYRVLVVEDNPVNQKVLKKYLSKIGVEFEVAVDGVECTEIVLSKSHKYYSLILCDLHMPRKDGYQACRELREWEKANDFPTMPIIALSANVMSDVQDKCVAAGFSDYLTKPVDFIDLSRVMAKFF
ncbi:hypothetical protein E4U21_005376 [Claviceps maximensis]|nr:hypothetical protein E4U21_005376 [Claviceps maximensis]